jgi:hypothetical protein
MSMATDPKLISAELAAGVAVAKKWLKTLPWYEQGAVTEEQMTSFIADVVSAIDTVRDQTPVEGQLIKSATDPLPKAM